MAKLGLKGKKSFFRIVRSGEDRSGCLNNTKETSTLSGTPGSVLDYIERMSLQNVEVSAV